MLSYISRVVALVEHLTNQEKNTCNVTRGVKSHRNEFQHNFVSRHFTRQKKQLVDLEKITGNNFYHQLFKVTTRNFQFLLIVVASWDKSSSDTSAYCRKRSLLTRARQAELRITPATHTFVLEVSGRETAG